jgi:hypothetical protein
MWQWIIDYVTLNRLEQQFAATFETLVSIAVQPNFHTMEASAWYEVPLVLTLPHFSPTRAKISLALEGEPYIPFAAAQEFILTDAREPGQCVVAAALSNYYMWLGAYAIFENVARTVSDWHYALLCNDESTDVLRSAYTKAAAISTITGREYTTMMTEGCFFRPNFESLSRVNTVHVAMSPDESVEAKIELTYIPSPVSGALVYGTVVSHFDVCAHLTGVQSIVPQHVYEPDKCFRTALQLSSLYRVFGHEVFWCKVGTTTEFSPYAASRTCLVDPYSMQFEAECEYNLRPAGSERREGRSITLPNIDNMFGEQKIGMRVSVPVVTMCEWNNRHKPLRPIRVLSRTKQPIVFSIRTGQSSNRAVLRSLATKAAPSDFQVAQHDIAPLIQVGIGTEQPIDVNTAATSNDV